MARIYKRGKHWCLDIRIKGRRIRRKVSTSKEIAGLALKDAEVKIAKDEFGFAKKEDQGTSQGVLAAEGR